LKVRTLVVALATATIMISIALGTARAHVPHTVQPGESLWSIAAANGVGVEQLAADNGLAPDALLVTGTTVQIPEAPSIATGAETSGSRECVWRCNSPVHPHPTDEVVGAEQVGEVADRYGMSPSMVQAMAWRESGFSNAAVSSAGARGVRQIIPDTWTFVDNALTESTVPTASAESNLEAGVIYLHHLYHLAGGDRERTIGSYFQGPNRDDLLPETRRYVRDVSRTQAAFGP
jgi:soluble lytic murein transglycosylase-like protein